MNKPFSFDSAAPLQTACTVIVDWNLEKEFIMQPTARLAIIALFAALITGPALAGDRDHDRQRDHQRQHTTDTRPDADQAMQVVPNDSTPGERAHGWRYFSDPATVRAVVISPQGDYYYSRGKGLRWIAAAQTGA